MGTEIQRRVNKNGMVISRIPSWAKDIITEKADVEHAGDYGACIAQMIRDAMEYDSLKTKFFNNQLDVNLMINDKHSEKVMKEESSIRTANGRVIEGGKK